MVEGVWTQSSVTSRPATRFHSVFALAVKTNTTLPWLVTALIPSPVPGVGAAASAAVAVSRQSAAASTPSRRIARRS